MDAHIPLGDDATLALTILAAFAVSTAYLRYRGHRALLHAIWLPAILVLAFCLPDALVTLQGTYTRPWYEANPFTRAFLMSAGWRGLCAAFFLWVLGWALVVDGIEELRIHLPELISASLISKLLRATQLYTVYAVAAGHLDGFASWTHAPAMVYIASTGLLVMLQQHAAWSMPVYPLAYLLYPSLVFGAVLTVCHYGVHAGLAQLRAVGKQASPMS